MALKAILDSIEGIPEPIAKEYVKGEDGKFTLAVEGAEDVGALKRAKDHEKAARQTAEKTLKELQTLHEKSQEEIDEMRRGAIPKGDVEKLEGSWRTKLEKKEAELNAQVAARDVTLKSLLVDNIAQTIAAKISNSPDLILPHIQRRLTTELDNGKFITRVLDHEGKPSALTIEELQKELTLDKRFAPIIIGSKASGGGASGGSGSGSGAPNVDLSKPFDWGKATPKEIAARIKAQNDTKQPTGG